MNDPVPNQGESEGAPVSAPQTPPTTQSYDIKMPDGSTHQFTPEPGGPADVKPTAGLATT